MSTAPSVDVLVLNWNGRAYLDACLSALDRQRFPVRRVVLIDNGSTDGSLDYARERYPHVTLLNNGRNLGFAAGNNAALRDNDADIVALVNPDVVPSADWLEKLVAALSADTRIAVAGSKLWYPDGITLQHAGGVITRPQAMPGHHGIGEADAGQHDTVRDTDYVIGGAIAIRREALQRVGLLDEGFFLYFEDVDYCFRARRAGFRVVYVPEAAAVHVESATAVKGSFSYLQRFHSGRWRFLLKHFDAGEIATQTLAAEAEWLDRVSQEERLAAGLAYTLTLSAWPSILASRTSDGAAALPAEHAEAIRRGLRDLERRAWTVFDLPPSATDPGPLNSAAEVSGRPFQSDVPVIGPLIATARAAWNAVAGRETVDRLWEQQNAFNREVAGCLHALAEDAPGDISGLGALVVAAKTSEEAQGESTQALARLQADIKAARSRLLALNERLDRLDNPG